MSKKLNVSGSISANNTLFKYFTKSPASDKKKISHAPVTPTSQKSSNIADAAKVVEKENLLSGGAAVAQSTPAKKILNNATPKSTKSAKKRKQEQSKELEEKTKSKPVAEYEEVVSSRGRKRKRLILRDSDDEDDNNNEDSKETEDGFATDDDGDEFKPSSSDEEAVSADESETEDEPSFLLEEEEADDFEANSDEEASDSDTETNKRRKHKNNSNNNNNNNVQPLKKKLKLEIKANGKTLSEKLQNMQQTDVTTTKDDDKFAKIVCTSSTLDEPVVWPHQKLEFLKPEQIKDKKGRRPEHPDYDAGTLFVPTSFLDSLSPGVRQWWVLKSDNFDCVLFFKVGKFYELYHMDADVGVKELGFTYMRGEFAHSGFPEVSFDKMSSILIERGYKIARVEQTETPDMMTERCKRIKPTKFDKVVRREICQISNRGTQVFGSQCRVTLKHQENYMLAIVEQSKDVCSRYGICYIDTSIGDFFIGEFDDDKNCSRLLTLLSHNMPVLVLNERNSLSERTLQIFRTVLAGVLKEQLPNSGQNQCSAEKTLKHLAENYFNKTTEDNWPSVLSAMQSDSDHLGLTPESTYKLGLKALGQCISYIQKCHLEVKVLPMARYYLYTPPDVSQADTVQLKNETTTTTEKTTKLSPVCRTHMVLDSTTLANLRITGEEYSLLSTLDNCCTKFGKRLLHYWLCSPSCDLDEITCRQAAITDLLEHTAELQDMRALIAPIPDLERHLAQIHLFGNKRVMENHPDGRAILFEEKLYNKKKIQSFIQILKGFESLMKIPIMLQACESPLIKRLTQLASEGGIFPDMQELIKFFKNAFDHKAAAKDGVIAPENGVDADYDECQMKIEGINQDLKEYLIEQEKYFGCRIVYFGTDKKRFQLEVPESYARKAGKDYQVESQRKGNKPVRRFSTNETRTLLKRMQNAEDERNNVLRDLARRIYEKFSNHYETWKQCVDCVSNLDVLGSLAEYARQQNTICVPEFAEPHDGQPFIQMIEGYHPCVAADTYIPNGITLGTDKIAPLSILTGPNMGGKSTLMRQVGLLVVMAQIGAHVPALKCKLSIVDRIFTRLGAQDDILAGHSTFLVELNETSLILKHATPHSLVLLDELGRGTATYDGTAIAASVVDFLADLKSRTLFSTHYHNLIDYFHKDARITLGHMACMVENEDTEDPTQETVTFLYKYSAGACPKSYGFNAAKLAGMTHAIIKRSYELSKKVEAIALKRKIAAKIVSASGGGFTDVDTNAIKNLLIQLKLCQL